GKVVNMETILRLLREHPSDVRWTTEMFSWLSTLLINSEVTQAEVDGKESNPGDEKKHILYFYPDLMPMFRAHVAVTGVSSSDLDKVRQDFPEVFKEYTPTLAEKVVFSLSSSNRYKELCKTEKEDDVRKYYWSQLLSCKGLEITPVELEYVRISLMSVKESG